MDDIKDEAPNTLFGNNKKHKHKFFRKRLRVNSSIFKKPVYVYTIEKMMGDDELKIETNFKMG